MKQQSRLIAIGAVIIILMIILSRSVVQVPTGAVGVQLLFKKALDTALPEGLHFVPPWINVQSMSIQLRDMRESTQVPSQEGLGVTLEATLFYRLKPDQAARVMREITQPYEQTFVRPQFTSVLRGTTASYKAEALYTAAREEVERRMLEAMEPALAGRGIVAERVLLHNITLPAQLQDAIERKLRKEQEIAERGFDIEVEKKAKQMKLVEAEKVAEFQRIVNQGMTENYLKWEGIQATRELANSKNTKVVIVGGSGDGLPLILNSE